MDINSRYSVIHTKMPRELLLLVGTGCAYGKCTFCDYHKDSDPEPFAVNYKIIARITGEKGMLDIINSGSAMELDPQTLAAIREKAHSSGIHTIWFEAHWLYHNQLEKLRAFFAPIKLKFRTGVETFNPRLRHTWCKGIPNEVTPQEIARYFNGVCLLAGVQGQSPEVILSDISTAIRYFEYTSVNIFTENSTAVKRDERLVEWFVGNIYERLFDTPTVEVLLNNTDLGVG